MRLLLVLALILLILWLHKAQMSSNNIPCEAVSLSDSAVSLLLSPLSLYSWLTSTLLRLVLSVPALVLSVLHHSLLLLIACPWCVASISLSLMLTVFHVVLYLLHLALVLGVVVLLSLSKTHLAEEDVGKKNVSYLEKTKGMHRAKSGLKVAGSRIGHQG